MEPVEELSIKLRKVFDARCDVEGGSKIAVANNDHEIQVMSERKFPAKRFLCNIVKTIIFKTLLYVFTAKVLPPCVSVLWWLFLLISTSRSILKRSAAI